MVWITWQGLGGVRPATEAQGRRLVGCRPDFPDHRGTEFLELTPGSTRAWAGRLPFHLVRRAMQVRLNRGDALVHSLDAPA